MTKNTSPTPEPADSSGNLGVKSRLLARFGTRFGLLAFFFFLAKGLAWLIVPTAVAWAASR